MTTKRSAVWPLQTQGSLLQNTSPGAIVRYETCGGGGYGDPLQRDTGSVERDVRDGKVSVERAASAYGVVIDPHTNEVQREATIARRAGRQAA